MLGPEMLGFLVLFGFDFSRFSLFCVSLFHHFLFCLFVVVEKEKKNCASIQYVLAGNPVVHGRSFNRECADKIF